MSEKELVEKLLEAEVEIDVVDRTGQSALHWAVMAGQEEMIELLLESGADVYQENAAGYNAWQLVELYKQEKVSDLVYNALGAIEFEDPVVEKVVREKINKETGVISPQDVGDISELSVLDSALTSLEGIQYLKNLKKLELDKNVLDLSEESVDKKIIDELADKDVEVIHLRTDMVVVEGGSFKREGKEITLSSFAISKYQVTQKIYQEIVGENPSHFSGENRPVECVSWWDAIKFCNELSREEGLAVAYDLNSGDLLDNEGNSTTDITKVEGYRLPTEAEWEFAARGGNESKGYKYAGSDNLDEVGWYNENSGGETHPVAEKKANQLGLYGMSGNVREWCQDYYDGDAYDKVSSKNPYMAEKGSDRVKRGGSWYNGDCDCELSYRDAHFASMSDNHLGFRSTRTV